MKTATMNAMAQANECLRITEVCEAGMLESYDPEHSYTFGDFLSIPERDHMLRQLFGRNIVPNTVDNELVFWKQNKQYAPDFNFALADTVQILYDENGKVLSPLLESPLLGVAATESLKMDFRCNSLAYVAHGNYADTRGKLGKIFFIDTDLGRQGKSYILLATKWGGANSKTRGISKSVAEELGAVYFEKVVSKGEQEGMDYIILPATTLHYIYCAVKATFQALAKQRGEFRGKWKRYAELTSELEKICNDNWKALDQAIDLQNECLEHSLANLAFVVVPERVDISELTIPSISIDMTKSEMLAAVSQARQSLKKVRRALVVKRVEIDAWKEFAPKFAKLQPFVTKRLHGWIDVFHDHATVSLPTTNGSERSYFYTTCAFSEQGLSNLIGQLKDYEQEEILARQRNEKNLRAFELENDEHTKDKLQIELK